MDGRKSRPILFLLLGISLWALLSPEPAQAVPSFARQTGVSCYTCHTVLMELTPFGRHFKLTGYTMSKGSKPYETFPPLAATVQGSYTEQKGLRNRLDPFDDAPDAKFNLPQQASLFYGGRIYDGLGAFAQLSYNGVANQLFLDNTDIRFAGTISPGGKSLVYGITVNNNPTVEDVWNSTPAFGFPFATSAVALTPAAGTIVDGVLSRQVGGIGIYGFWNNLIYADFSIYRSNNKGITRPFGAGTTIDTVVDGAVPYWRVALQHQWNQHSFMLGTYGLVANIFPGGASSGGTDKFTDIAVDAQYQFISSRHLLSLRSTWIHEKQDRGESFSQGLSASDSDTLITFKISGSYYYRSSFGTMGGALGYFSTTGDTDTLLYAPTPLAGSVTGSPDSRGYILEADYLPWDKLKISLQYIIYDKFNGARTNYDGFGRKASDNNTFYFLLWLAL